MDDDVSFEDFLDTSVAPKQMDPSIREEALRLAYSRSPGLAKLVTGTQLTELGTKEFDLGILALAASFALDKYYGPLSIAVGLASAALLGKGSYDIWTGVGRRNDGADQLRYYGPQYNELIKNSNTIGIAGQTTSIAHIGLGLGFMLARAHKAWVLAPLSVGTAMVGVQAIKNREFESELDQIAHDTLFGE